MAQARARSWRYPDKSPVYACKQRSPESVTWTLLSARSYSDKSSGLRMQAAQP
jgi:hypothetical protein